MGFVVRYYDRGGGGIGVPTRSLQHVRASAQNLSMSSGNFDWNLVDKTKFAISMWFKRDSLSGGNFHFLYQKAGGGVQNSFYAGLTPGNKLNIATYQDGASVAGELLTTATYTNTTDPYHLLFHYDSANATSGNRMRAWLNGAEITAFDTDTAPTAAVFNGTDPVRIGGDGGAGSNYDGLIYQPTFFSGFLPDISQVYNAGAPIDVSTLSGLHSLLNTNATDALELDYVRPTNWTNNNGVTKSTDVP